jgi:hypothetical protein
MTPQTDSKKRDVTRGESCSMFSREPSVLVAMMSQARERRASGVWSG